MSTAADSFPLDLRVSPFHEEQFTRSQFDHPRSLSPEARVCWAILEDCFLARCHSLRHPKNLRSQHQRERDEDWINGADAPILFADLCDLLGIPADLVRRRYHALTRGQRVSHKASTFG
jgi:hypothetical protein